MLCHPALFPAEPACNSKRKALLAQEHVSAVARSDRPDRVILREMANEALLGIKLAFGMQALHEIRRIAKHIHGNLPHSRHNSHIQNNINAVGYFNADLAEFRESGTHDIRNHVHRSALHAALKEGSELCVSRALLHPVVRRSCVFLFGCTNKCKMFHSCNIVFRCSMI